MNRRAALRLLAGGLCSTGLTGCLTDGSWTVEKILGWDDPKTPKVRAAHIATAQRVEELGRKIIAQNTFTGLDPLFHTLGKPELLLFHRGTAELFISDELAERCKTDVELAAVLCSELGQMIAEQRAARSVGRDKEPIPDTPLPGTGFAATGAYATEVGQLKKNAPTSAPGESADPTALARQLLQGMGFDSTKLDQVGPLLKQCKRDDQLQKQIAGSAPAPSWTE